MDRRVVVYVLTSNSDSVRTQKTQSLFDNKYFVVRVTTISAPESDLSQGQPPANPPGSQPAANPPVNAAANAQQAATPATPTTPGAQQQQKKLNQNDYLEAYRVKWVLEDAARRFPNSYVIISKDTSVSNATSDRIAAVVSAAIKSGGWDVFYLS